MARNGSLYICVFFMFSGCQSPLAWWKSINFKAQEIRTLQARYNALSKDHDLLQKKYLELERQLAEGDSIASAREKGARNLKATGSPLGRTLATVSYRVPEGLPPSDVLDLAFEHLRERRYGESAKTFQHYFSLPETAGMTDASAHYAAGVAYFQIGNYQEAKGQWALAKASAKGEQRENIAKKVDLWLRVLDRKIASVPAASSGEKRRGPALDPGVGEPEFFPKVRLDKESPETGHH